MTPRDGHRDHEQHIGGDSGRKKMADLAVESKRRILNLLPLAGGRATGGGIV
jgi:hypothetical protein